MSIETNGKFGHGFKAGYGISELGLTGTEILIQLSLLYYYTQVIGLRAELVGLALAVAVIWDSLTDPIMGAISDRLFVRGHLNRHRIFILPGGILLGLSFPFLFFPPTGAGELTLFLYLLSACIVVNTAATLIAVPFAALGAELSDDNDERTQIFGYRLLFGNIGMLVGVILPAIFLGVARYNPDGLVFGYQPAFWTGLCVGALVILCSLVTFLVTGRRSSLKTSGDSRVRRFRQEVEPLTRAVVAGAGVLLRDILAVFRNRNFLVLLAAFFTATLGRTLNSSIAILYYENFLLIPEAEVFLKILIPFFIVISCSIIFWVIISRRYGKKYPAFLGVLTLGILGSILYPLFSPREFAGPIFMAIAGGICVGSILLFETLVADIADGDKYRSPGTSSDGPGAGVYFGVWRLASKVARASGLIIAGYALGLDRFSGGGEITEPRDGAPSGVSVWTRRRGLFYSGRSCFPFIPGRG